MNAIIVNKGQSCKKIFDHNIDPSFFSYVAL
jgi:hypothetical protein